MSCLFVFGTNLPPAFFLFRMMPGAREDNFRSSGFFIFFKTTGSKPRVWLAEPGPPTHDAFPGQPKLFYSVVGYIHP